MAACNSYKLRYCSGRECKEEDWKTHRTRFERLSGPSFKFVQEKMMARGKCSGEMADLYQNGRKEMENRLRLERWRLAAGEKIHME